MPSLWPVLFLEKMIEMRCRTQQWYQRYSERVLLVTPCRVSSASDLLRITFRPALAPPCFPGTSHLTIIYGAFYHHPSPSAAGHFSRDPVSIPSLRPPSHHSSHDRRCHKPGRDQRCRLLSYSLERGGTSQTFSFFLCPTLPNPDHIYFFLYVSSAPIVA